jgi:hypothetical protein
MEIQSLVIDSRQIELSLGSNDGGREYVFARLPFNGDDYRNKSLDDVRIASLNRVREAIDGAISGLNGKAPSRG